MTFWVSMTTDLFKMISNKSKSCGFVQLWKGKLLFTEV